MRKHRTCVLFFLCFAAVTAVGTEAAASDSSALSPPPAFQKACDALNAAEEDLSWLERYTGEKEIKQYVRDLRGLFACARLDSAAFKKSNKDTASATPSYHFLSEEPLEDAAIRKILDFLESSRTKFFAGDRHTQWDTMFFWESRALLRRLLAETFLKKSDAVWIERLKSAQQSRDIAQAVIALYRLRRFDEVLTLAPHIPPAEQMQRGQAIEVLRALKGALDFTGRNDAAGKVQAAIRRLGGKAQEAGRPILELGNIFVGSAAKLAETAKLCAQARGVFAEAAQTGREAALLDLVTAQCAFGAGDSEFAAPFFARARTHAGDGYLGVFAAAGLGVCSESLGRYEDAVRAFRRSRSLAKRLGNGRAARYQMINLVSVYRALNRLEEAQTVLTEALEHADEVNEELWIRLLLVTLKHAQGKKKPFMLDDAIFICKRAIKRLDNAEKGAIDEKDYLRALFHVNYGAVLRRKALVDPEGRRHNVLREALSQMQKGLDCAQKAGRTRLSVVAGANCAELYLDAGDLKNAQAFAEWALTSAKKINYFETIWRARVYLGRIAEARNDYAASEAQYRSAVDMVETYRRSLSREDDRTAFLQDKTEAYQSLVRVLLEKGDVKEAFSAAERAKAKSALESLGLKELIETLGSDEKQVVELAKMLRRPPAETSTISSSASPFVEAVSLDQVYRQLDALKKRASASQEVRPALSYFFGASPQPADVQQTLSAGEVLLEYFVIGDRLAVWVIDADTVHSEVLPGSWSELAADVERFVSQKACDAALASKIGSCLFAPFKGKAFPEKLFVVPAGLLYRMPFEALKVQGNYVLEKAQVRYAPSASFDLLLAKKRAAVSNTLFFGLSNPSTDYDGDGRGEKVDLAFAEQELDSIKTLYNRRKTYSGASAKEALVRRSASQAQVVHLACHGIYKAHDPWSSALFLAPGDGEDGMLHAWEIMRLDFSGADLVTLSGCETGVSSIEPGDDLVGLPRGFLLAGARTLVASLWPVEDRATAHLMKTFYKALADEKAPAEALRLARLSLLRDKTLSSPANWAAFILFGRSAVGASAGTEDQACVPSGQTGGQHRFPVWKREGRTGFRDS